MEYGALVHNSQRSSRIAVITNGNYFSSLLVSDLLTKHHNDIVVMMVVTGDYTGLTGFRALRKHLGTTTLPYLIYKIVSIGVFAVVQRILRNKRYFSEQLATDHAIAVKHFTRIACGEAIEVIRRARVDLIVSVSCPQLIPDEALRAARRGGINIHSSLLPKFKGIAPYYWVLAEGESHTGVTVHYMTSTFDAGNIIGQVETPIAPSESAFSLFERLARMGAPLLTTCVARALSGDLGSPPQEHPSYRSHPTFRSYFQLRRRGHALVHVAELGRAISGSDGQRRGHAFAKRKNQDSSRSR